MIKKLKKFVVVLVTLLVAFGALTVGIAKVYGGTDTVNPSPGYSPITFNPASIPLIQADVLLIQDTLPWGSNANATVLSSLGYTYNIVTMNSVPSIDLSKYRFVLIASDQSQSFYNTYAANSSLFEDYVKNGGVLVFFACYGGWAGGTLTAPLPGGVTTVVEYEYYNLISDSNHPIVTDELTEGTPITDADLWSTYCSHVSFNNLIAQVASGSIKNLDVIFKAQNSGKPTLVEYQVGKGTVIASGNTWEHGYYYGRAFATKGLDDIFKYAFRYTITASAGQGGSITPSGEIKVSHGSSQTFTIKADTAGYMIMSILVDGNPIFVNNSFEMTYTFVNISTDHTISAIFGRIPDTTPPILNLPPDLSVPGGLTLKSSSLTFAVLATDDSGIIARMVVKVNGVVQIDKSNLDPTITLNEGFNNVEVIVYDGSGNYTTKSFTVTVDTKPPVISAMIPETVFSTELVVKGNVFDAGTGVKILTINGNPIMAGQGDFETKLTLSSGVNNIIIEAVDRVGNKATKTFMVRFVQPSTTSFLVILKIDSPTITINGTSKKIDAQGSKPIIKNGRVLLPVRVLIESLGGTVKWDAAEKKVTIELNGHSMVLTIGQITALVDGSKATLDVAPMLINGRTYLPLRFISENFGASVNWDESTQTVTIYYWL